MIERLRLRHILNDDESKEGHGFITVIRALLTTEKNILVTDFSVSFSVLPSCGDESALCSWHLAWLQINYHPPAPLPHSPDHEMWLELESFLILSSNEYSISSYHSSPHAFA